MPGLDLSSINLPEEDKNKPAGDDSVITNEDGSVRTVTDETVTPDPKDLANGAAKANADKEAAGDKAELKENKDKPGDSGSPDSGDKSAKPDGAEAGAADDSKKTDENGKPKEELTPFHQHPDWIKSQNEKKDLEDKVKFLEGQIGTLTELAKTSTPAEKAAVTKTAEERINEDIQNGWKPASQIEVIQRSMKYMREEYEAKDAEKAAAQKAEADKAAQSTQQSTEFAAKVETAIEDAFKSADINLTDQTQKDLVMNTAAELIKNKVLQPVKDPATVAPLLKFVTDKLKAEGKLGAAAPVVEDPSKKAEMDKKAEVNGKIARSNGEDGAGAKDQKLPLAKGVIRGVEDAFNMAREQLEGTQG